MNNSHNKHTKGATHEAQFAVTSASFHALAHMESIERELATLPPDGDVTERLTATADEGLGIYQIAMPQDKEDRYAYCCGIAARLAADGAVSAAVSTTGMVVRGEGRERICVVAADRFGGEEGWTARVIRSDTEPPRIREWECGEPGGNFLLMLRAGVTNLAGRGK
ncbi:MAG: hypothetical protein ABSH36_01890 [Solirubrobacteraceae bacterium]|jgi:hypothetical protein